jgi:hypothetical protein
MKEINSQTESKSFQSCLRWWNDLMIDKIIW